jgi:hypothetical protein
MRAKPGCQKNGLLVDVPGARKLRSKLFNLPSGNLDELADPRDCVSDPRGSLVKTYSSATLFRFFSNRGLRYRA